MKALHFACTLPHSSVEDFVGVGSGEKNLSLYHPTLWDSELGQIMSRIGSTASPVLKYLKNLSETLTQTDSGHLVLWYHKVSYSMPLYLRTNLITYFGLIILTVRRQIVMSTLVVSYYPHSYECNFSNCAEKPEFFRLLSAIGTLGL